MLYHISRRVSYFKVIYNAAERAERAGASHCKRANCKYITIKFICTFFAIRSTYHASEVALTVTWNVQKAKPTPKWPKTEQKIRRLQFASAERASNNNNNNIIYTHTHRQQQQHADTWLVTSSFIRRCYCCEFSLSLADDRSFAASQYYYYYDSGANRDRYFHKLWND